MLTQTVPDSAGPEAICPAHPDQPSTGTCGRCGRFFCGQCSRLQGLCWECERRKFVQALPSTSLLARLTQVLMGIRVVPAALSMAIQLWLFIRLEAGLPRLEDAQTHDAVLLALDRPMRVLFLLSAVFFLPWLHYSVRVANALGRSWQCPWWAVLCWFIPLVNLVVAYQSLHRLRANLGIPARDRLLPFFWAASLCSGLAIGLQSDLSRAYPDSVPGLLLLGSAGNALTVAGCVLSVLIIGQTQGLVDARKAGALKV